MEQIGSIIKDIRKKNNLTQNEFASILGVTFQAVSKWENDKSIPDITILKDISNKFNVDLNYLISGKKVNINKKSFFKKNMIIITAIIFIIISVCVFLFFHKHNYEFKTLNGETKDIKVTGSITYDESKSSIYLNVDYNADDTQKYSYIKCTLYEKHQDILNVISEKEYLEKTPVSLKEYLKMISFVIDNYSPSCKYYKDSNLYLEISAKIDEEKSVTYKVPIKFNNC
ncbi:MAG: helix-turn-helix transcriptional regulator [Bacilli bacterium]|nr:helix-turn-helix transcriptional regulator [Bacilli bacterium]